MLDQRSPYELAKAVMCLDPDQTDYSAYLIKRKDSCGSELRSMVAIIGYVGEFSEEQLATIVQFDHNYTQIYDARYYRDPDHVISIQKYGPWWYGREGLLTGDWKPFNSLEELISHYMNYINR